jgi:hypothetical protein
MPAKKSPRSKLVLEFKDGRKSAKLGDVVVLKNGAHAEVYQKTDAEGKHYAALKFVSPAKKSPIKKSANKKSPIKKSPMKSPIKKSPNKTLELKPKSENNLSRSSFCF